MFSCFQVFVYLSVQVEKALCNELWALSCLLMTLPKTTYNVFCNTLITSVFY